MGRAPLVGNAALETAAVKPDRRAEQRVAARLEDWMETAARPAIIAGTIVGFVFGLWFVLDCEPNCYPLIGDILSVIFFAGMGAFVLYCATAFFFIGIMAVLTVISFLYHLVFREGPTLAERRAQHEVDAAARQDRLAKVRTLAQDPEYQRLKARRKELHEAADHADEIGDIARRDALREEAFAAWKAIEALEHERIGSD